MTVVSESEYSQGIAGQLCTVSVKDKDGLPDEGGGLDGESDAGAGATEECSTLTSLVGKGRQDVLGEARPQRAFEGAPPLQLVLQDRVAGHSVHQKLRGCLIVFFDEDEEPRIRRLGLDLCTALYFCAILKGCFSLPPDKATDDKSNYARLFLDDFAKTQGNKTQDFSKTQRKFPQKLKVPEGFP